MSSDSQSAQLRMILHHRGELLAESLTDREIRARLDRGELHRLQRGWYVSAAQWRALSSRDQHVILALAIDAGARSVPVFSHATAALLHGLPMYGHTDPRVHVSVGTELRRHNSRLVIRHRREIEADQVVERAGLRCTSLARTVLDVARSMSLETGIVCGDAALGAAMKFSRQSASQILEQWTELLAASAASRGGVRARTVIQMVDPQADSPLESLSRLQLLRLGFQVATQVPVAAPSGAPYRMDFELLGHDVFAEVDGRVKYTDERLRAGRSMEQILLAEKEREDWVRGITGKRVVRWGWAEAQTRLLLARRLMAFGIRVPALSGRSAG